MAHQPCQCSNELSGRRRILLVEDEPFVREATCSILQNAGFDVLPAEDARQALKAGRSSMMRARSRRMVLSTRSRLKLVRLHHASNAAL